MENFRLKELRSEKKCTQQEISDKTEISRSVISEYESGKSEPTASVLIKLANFFDVSTDYLLGISDELGGTVLPNSPALSHDDKKLLDAYHGLEPKLRSLLWDMLETWQKNSVSLSETGKINA